MTAIDDKDEIIQTMIFTSHPRERRTIIRENMASNNPGTQPHKDKPKVPSHSRKKIPSSEIILK